MDLALCRAELDKIDDEIARLFSKRMEIVAKVARYKAQHQIGALDKSREEEILARVAALSNEEYAADTKALFSYLFELSRSYQRRLFEGGSLE